MYQSDLETKFPNMKILYNHPLSDFTYTKTGGPCDILMFPTSITEVKDAVNWTKSQKLDLTIFGNASNLIVRDGGIRGVGMMMTELNKVAIENEMMTVQSGATIIEVSQLAQKKGLSGLEFACGIPGSVGGAVYMNAGAYGGEVKEVILSVDVLTQNGEVKQYSNQECEFTYRNSIFQETKEIILSVTFGLKEAEKEVIKKEMERVTELRQTKQPLEYPSCGSVFKRPEGYYTGQLIQEAGLQGYRIGGAEVSRKHAGFIVNVDHATATDYLDMIAHIQEVIWEKNKVRLEPEVRIIGEEV